jgi:hypothetical protein
LCIVERGGNNSREARRVDFVGLRTNDSRIVSTHSSLTPALPLLLRSWTLPAYKRHHPVAANITTFFGIYFFVNVPRDNKKNVGFTQWHVLRGGVTGGKSKQTKDNSWLPFQTGGDISYEVPLISGERQTRSLVLRAPLTYIQRPYVFRAECKQTVANDSHCNRQKAVGVRWDGTKGRSNPQTVISYIQT